MTKAAFIAAVVGALAWFAREAWPYVKRALDDREIRLRAEKLKDQRERDRTAGE